MSWKFVLDTSKRLAGGDTIKLAYELAMMSGYKFFAFNGKVYFAVEGKVMDTGITTEDLF